MRARTFAWFVGPSVLLMLLFIAAPLVSVLVQSFYVTAPVLETVEVETCTPGFTGQICEVSTKTRPLIDGNGKVITTTEFVGLQSYRNVLETDRAIAALSKGNFREFLSIDFWKALRFTLTFTFITLPIMLMTGVGIALAVNLATARIRGHVIFVSLLPFIVTPVIGALSIKWVFIGDGMLTVLIEWWLARDIALFAQAWTIEILMLFYRVWHVAPFAFVVFYAGLQTLNMDSVESAIIDGATRWQRLRFIVIPHLMPLIVFLTIIHLMDSYRVFEEIVDFGSENHVISLQWITYDLLTPDDAGNRSISRASASSMLTMIGIVILLVFPLRQTWRDHFGKTA